MQREGHPYIKHMGNHMEEIALDVVSTENWSYDYSGSDLEPLYFVFDSPES